MLRLILAVVESLYYYLRLYGNIRRKRLLFRKKHLVLKQSLLDREVYEELNQEHRNEHGEIIPPHQILKGKLLYERLLDYPSLKNIFFNL
jgi:hypothetical protein